MRWLFLKLVFSSFESFTSLESMADATHELSVEARSKVRTLLRPSLHGVFSLFPKVPVEVLCSSSLFGVSNCSSILSVNVLVCSVSILRHPMRLTASPIGGEPCAILLHGSRLSDRNMLGKIGKKAKLGFFFLVAPQQISKIQTFWGSFGIRSLIRFQGQQMLGVSSRQHRLFHVFVYDMKDISTILNCRQIKT